MIVIIDYGVGNLFSLKSSFLAIDKEAIVSSNIEDIKKADRLILPGVGAFSDAAKKLKDSNLFDVVINEAKKGKPILGICLGMQLLFEKSFEYGEHLGLGLIKGEVRGINEVIDNNLKIPHIGWNGLKLKKDCPLFKYIKDGDYVYFVHSYYATNCDESVCAIADYSYPLTAVVQNKNIFGCQFHPEKSGNIGLNILKAFCEV